MLNLTVQQREDLLEIHDELNQFHFKMQEDFEDTYKYISECNNGMELASSILAFNNNYGVDFTPSYRPGNLPDTLEKLNVLKELAENFYEYMMQDRVKIQTVWDLAHNELHIPEPILEEDRA
jgi:hypothetical protein